MGNQLYTEPGKNSRTIFYTNSRRQVQPLYGRGGACFQGEVLLEGHGYRRGGRGAGLGGGPCGRPPRSIAGGHKGPLPTSTPPPPLRPSLPLTQVPKYLPLKGGACPRPWKSLNPHPSRLGSDGCMVATD